MDYMVLKSRDGMVCIQADSIRLNQVKLLSQNTDPVISLQDSKHITLDHFSISPNPVQPLVVSGAGTRNIRITDSDSLTYKGAIRFLNGAAPDAVE
jgi:hypothetical protein